jgi:hypothetical protein
MVLVQPILHWHDHGDGRLRVVHVQRTASGNHVYQPRGAFVVSDTWNSRQNAVPGKTKTDVWTRLMLWAWLWFFGKSKIEKTVGDDSVALVFETFIIRGTAIYLSNTAPVRNIGKRMAGNLNGFTNDSKPGKIDVVFMAIIPFTRVSGWR